jgi:hypothetical protein
MGELVLDGGVLTGVKTHDILRGFIKKRCIEYAFPQGLNHVDTIDACRLLSKTGDFKSTYDYTLRAILKKTVAVSFKELDGTKRELARFKTDDICQNLRDIKPLDEYPCLFLWLIDHVQMRLMKDVAEAWKESTSSVQQDDGDKGGIENHIVKACFGDSMLFMCYRFLHEMHTRPKSFLELFEFIKYCKTDGKLKEAAMSMAKTGR